jgi:type I restriction enzyme, S subunit
MKWFDNMLPERWTTRKLKRITRLRYGETLPIDDREEGSIPVFGSNGITGTHSFYNQHAPSLVIGRKGTFGKVTFSSEPLFLIDTAYGIDFRETENDLKWLFYALSISTIDKKMRDSPVPGLSSRDAYSIDFPYPPFSEQKKIVAYLDASCALIDRTLDKKQKQLKNLDLLYKSIITTVILKGIKPKKLFRKTLNTHLSQIPEDWKLVSLKRISEIKGGLTLGKTYEGSLVMKPYLRAANVQDGYLDLKEVSEIEIPEQLTQKYELQYEDILMTEGGDLDKLGRGYIWEGQIEGCLHQNHVFAISTNQRLLLPKFLMYLTASQFGRDYFESTGKRTTNLASTNSTKVGLLPIPLPPIYEQREIVSYIENNLKQVQKINESIFKQVNKLLNFRKSLIHECVTGMRSITDTDIAKVKAYVSRP